MLCLKPPNLRSPTTFIYLDTALLNKYLTIWRHKYLTHCHCFEADLRLYYSNSVITLSKLPLQWTWW